MYVRHTICPRHPVCVAFSLGSRQAVVCSPPHGSFTPTVVLTEPPPLFETVAGREYHCHSDCHGHAGCNPALAGGSVALPGWGSWRTRQRRLTLSRIVGTDVLDEWVFGFQGACEVPFGPHTPHCGIFLKNATLIFKIFFQAGKQPLGSLGNSLSGHTEFLRNRHELSLMHIDRKQNLYFFLCKVL